MDTPEFRVCVVVPSPDSAATEEASAQHSTLGPVGSVFASTGQDPHVDELLKAGFTHVICLGANDKSWASALEVLRLALQETPGNLFLASADDALAPRRLRWAIRSATDLRLREPYSPNWGCALQPLAELSKVSLGRALSFRGWVQVSWAGLQVEELAVLSPTLPITEVEYPGYSPLASLGWLLPVTYRCFLPPAFLELASRRSYQALPMKQRVHEGLLELFLREPGSNGRIAASAGFGFFMALIPLWGYQILLTVLLSPRLGLSKTVSLLCAQISLPPLIPFIIYGSLLFGRALLGMAAAESTGALDIAPQDFMPWFLGSWVLAALVGVVGGSVVWLLVSFLRRTRGSAAE